VHFSREGAVMVRRPSFGIVLGFVTFAMALTAAFCAQRLQARERQHVATVPVAALEKLLPAPAGWTKTDAKSDQVVVSADCSHPVATVVYTQREKRVKITIADSGGNQESLVLLAPMVVMLPEGYSGQVPPATRIVRLARDGSQVAERWDEGNGDGEITMLVKGRFVASVEGSHVDSLDTLRAIIGTIDFKQLADLK
jgi:invasion protein IalB